ncbi:MAG: toxin-antitoxin system HicB family antitoxin [Steroidobacteraceae bacterium]
MSTLTIRLPDAKHRRLRAAARSRGVSVNKLIEELATIALAQQDAENRYRLRVRQGRPEQGLALLDGLDRREGSATGRSRSHATRSRKTTGQR